MKLIALLGIAALVLVSGCAGWPFQIVIGHPASYLWTENHIVFNIDVKQLAEGSKPPSFTKCIELPPNSINGISSAICNEIGGSWQNYDCWYTQTTTSRVVSATDEYGTALSVSVASNSVCFEDTSEYWSWANAPKTVHLYFDVEEPPTHECVTADDCEGNAHPATVGHWECQDGNCVWADDEEPPCCDIPWYIYLALAIIIVLAGIWWWKFK